MSRVRSFGFLCALRGVRTLAPFTSLLAVCALALSTGGCAASSKYMIAPALPVPTVAPPNMAVVMFIRHSLYGAGVVTTILDDRGAFLGDSIAGTEFSVTLPPGPHLFLAWAENTAPLSASLLPGRVYYVEVSPHMGFWSTRIQLLAITPRSDNWRDVTTWISDCTQLVPDTASGQAYLYGRSEKVAERIRRAHERIGELDSEELAARTLLPEDGVPSVTLISAPTLGK